MYCISLTLSVTTVKFRITLKVRNVIHIVHVSQVCTLLLERLSTNSPISTAQLAHTKCHCNPFTSWMEYSKLEEHLWWI